MLPSINGSSLPEGLDDRTEFLARVDGDSADRLDVERTTIVPRVAPPSRVRAVLPWAAFGAVAVVIVAATTMWASSLRGSQGLEAATSIPPPIAVSASAVPTSPPPAAATVPAAVPPAPVVAQRKRSIAPVRTTVVKAPVVAATPTVVASTSATSATTSAGATKAVLSSREAGAGAGSAPTARVATPSSD